MNMATKKAAPSHREQPTIDRYANKHTVQRKYYITNKRKMQVLFFCVFVVFLAIATILVIHEALSQPNFTTEFYKAESGDTLWSIAKQTKPDYVSFQEYWDFILENNNSEVYPGDIITIAGGIE